MSRTIPNAGTHPAKTNAAMVVYQTEKTGSLCVAIPTALVDGSWSGKGTVVLIKGDGTPMENNIQSMKDIFGWAGLDPFELESILPGENEFDIVGIHEPYTPEPTDDNPNPDEVMGFKIQWFNAKGRTGIKMPEVLDETKRRNILTKFGGKFKALSGGAAPAQKKSVPAAEPESNDPPVRGGTVTPPSRRKPPGGVARTSTQQEVWNGYLKAQGNPTGAVKEKLAEDYYAAQDEIAPGKNGELSPVEWGQVADKLGI